MEPKIPNESVVMDQMTESFKLLINALNKGCTTGVFNLDEAYLIKVAANNIEKALVTLDKHQKYVEDCKRKIDSLAIAKEELKKKQQELSKEEKEQMDPIKEIINE